MLERIFTLFKNTSWLYVTVADSLRWLGMFILRKLRAQRGLCLVCNNLQPYYHELSLGFAPRSVARWGHSQRIDLVKEPALVLTGIDTENLLLCREIDPKTGKPIRSCGYCEFICDVLDSFFIDDYMSWVTDTKNGMFLEIGFMIREGAPLVINCLGNFTYDTSIMYPRVDIEVFVENGDLLSVPGAPTLGLTLDRVMNSADPSCLQFELECLTQCYTSHPDCQHPMSDFVPRRLLYLGTGDDEIKLVEGSRPQGWTALSHCWGGHEPLRLLMSNIHQLKQRIAHEDLPNTFKDAIQVCRGLSLDYLWIDSLCIIQDDTEDWAQQAAQMHDVYQGAFLVLVAASSPNPDTPFLGPRSEEWATWEYKREMKDGNILPTRARKRSTLAAPLDHGIYEPPFTDSWAFLKRTGPLYRRGWCYQESYLATRSLHFAPGSVIFECKTHRRAQDSPAPYPLLLPGSLGNVSDGDKWRFIVQAYTACRLSFASDKLLAVAGIAQDMPQAKGNNYLAGLWSDTLLNDLLWQIMPTDTRTRTVVAYLVNDQKAPSWSWASISQGVLWNRYRDFKPLASVLSADCPLDRPFSPYGNVNGGRITLRGRLLPCRMIHRSQRGTHHAYYIKSNGSRSSEKWFLGDGCIMPAIARDGGEAYARRAFAEEDASAGMRDFDIETAFFCVAKTSRTSFNYVGLIVSKSERFSGCYERVGEIASLGRDWFYNGQEMEIILT